MWRIYVLKTCDSCRRAVKLLRECGEDFETIPIRESPPTREELERALESVGGEVRRLFNVSGREYRVLGLGERLPGLSKDAALDLLAANGSLVKRPLAFDGRRALVGFDESRWRGEFPASL